MHIRRRVSITNFVNPRYDLMLNCWGMEPNLRPSFGECKWRIGRYLERMDAKITYSLIKSQLPKEGPLRLIPKANPIDVVYANVMPTAPGISDSTSNLEDRPTDCSSLPSPPLVEIFAPSHAVPCPYMTNGPPSRYATHENPEEFHSQEVPNEVAPLLNDHVLNDSYMANTALESDDYVPVRVCS